jgi:hypothetical protein
VIPTSQVDDPLLTTAEAAELLGSDERGVRFLMLRGGKLQAEPEQFGRRILLRFRRSAVEAVRPYYRRLRDFQDYGRHDHPEHGRQLTLLEAAREHAVPLYQLRQAVKEGQIPAEDLNPPPTGLRPWKIVLERDVLALKVRTSGEVRDGGRLNRQRWKLVTEIQAAVGAVRPCDRADVSALVQCWVRLGRLTQRPARVRQSGKVPVHGEGLKAVERSRVLTFYDFSQFKRLWDRDFIAEGARKLRALVARGGERCPAREAAEELAALGIAGKGRISRVVRAAGMRGVHDRGLEAENRIVYVPDRDARRQDPAEVVRAVLSAGPVSAGEGRRKARALGLTTAEVYAALRKLGVAVQAKDKVGTHVWELPASRPRPRGRPKGKVDSEVQARNARMIKDWQAGQFATIADLARHYNVARPYASDVLKAAGVR